MIILQKHFPKIFLVLLTMAIYTPKFGVLDRMSIQYFLMSIIVFITVFLIPFLYKKIDLKSIFYNPLAITYGLFILFAFLSMLKSINIIESLVRLNQLVVFFLLLIILLFFIKKNLIQLNFILGIVLITLLIDLFFSLKVYYEIVSGGVDYGYEYNYLLAGLQGNRNILASTIIFRIPLVILLLLRLKKNWLSILSFVIITISFYNVFLLSSRAAYLSISICVLFSLVYTFFNSADIKSYFKLNSYLSAFYIIPCIIALLITTQTISSEDKGDVASRISSIASENDPSKNTRLRYYKQSISHIFKNPFLGAGIGNWKIVSIKYDKENIENYIIPYNAHNDILEATAETGILGGTSFGLFFFYIFIYLFKFLRAKLMSIERFSSSLLIFLPFIVYFIDLNLNFPSSRPLNLYFLLLLISVIIITKKTYDKEN